MLDALTFPRGAATAPPRIRQWIRANFPQMDMRVGLTCDNYEVLVSTAERTDMLVLGPTSIRYSASSPRSWRPPVRTCTKLPDGLDSAGDDHGFRRSLAGVGAQPAA